MGSLITSTRPAAARQRHAAGFTLLELLVVIVIAGIMLGVVSFNAIPDPQKVLQEEARRIALLMQLARDEAIVRNRPIAFEVGQDRYRFLIRDDVSWQPMGQDDMLREREFRRPPVSVSIQPMTEAGSNPLRVVFGREPVDKPFVLTLAADDASVSIRADGIGHFVVE
ncbi:GspH/FimT family pseudopilin [Noviherbaspirillum galbum]|uniref:GspH/FimT family pseudopilin n=1 Tax=Noviherbaspirillum galbum TaxID=2709383 RepID=UPI002E2AA0FE|nr:GspH/FimT family pseudopilin [Noviherbaspirillum galbum]